MSPPAHPVPVGLVEGRGGQHHDAAAVVGQGVAPQAHDLQADAGTVGRTEAAEVEELLLGQEPQVEPVPTWIPATSAKASLTRTLLDRLGPGKPSGPQDGLEQPGGRGGPEVTAR